MKHLLPLILTTLVTALAIAQEPKPAKAPDTKPAPPLDEATLKEKVSYFYGGDVAKHLRDNGVDVSVDSFIQGLKDTLDKGKAKYTEEELDTAMNQFAQAMMAKRQKDMAEAGTKNAETGKKFLEDNGKRKEVTTTASGLQYEVIKKGDGDKPKADDQVTVHYTGTLVDGKVFDSSRERGEPATFPVGGVIKGWIEALQLMPVGSRWKLVIPSDLAYGPQGNRGIAPNSTLIFDVELLNIAKK